MAQLRRYYPELRAAGGEVLVISFDPLERAERYAREHDLPFPLLVDPARQVYRAYGLEQAPLWRILMPKVVLGTVQLLQGGRQLQRPHEDPLQLGGDFVVDPTGVLALVHPCQDPTDRPAPAALVAAVGHATVEP